jgi:hypothetical protein
MPKTSRPQPVAEPTEQTEDLEEMYERARQNLALLERWADAEHHTDRGGTSIDLEHDAWRAVERMLHEARECLERQNDNLEMVDASTAGGAR